VTSIDHEHGIDTQQLFAQLAILFRKGEPWWLTQEEERCLEEHNKDHRRVSVIRDWVLEALDLNILPESRPV
jgi:putative DNA primase/helicase